MAVRVCNFFRKQSSGILSPPATGYFFSSWFHKNHNPVKIHVYEFSSGPCQPLPYNALVTVHMIADVADRRRSILPKIKMCVNAYGSFASLDSIS